MGAKGLNNRPCVKDLPALYAAGLRMGNHHMREFTSLPSFAAVPTLDRLVQENTENHPFQG